MKSTRPWISSWQWSPGIKAQESSQVLTRTCELKIYSKIGSHLAKQVRCYHRKWSREVARGVARRGDIYLELLGRQHIVKETNIREDQTSQLQFHFSILILILLREGFPSITT